MSRYMKITMFTLACFCLNINNKSFACDQDPIPVITTEPTSVFITYMDSSDSMVLNSISYDPDNGEPPYDPGEGIAKWNWDLWHYPPVNDYIYPRHVNINSSYTFSASAILSSSGPGHYAVDLNVLDDDHEDIEENYINGYNYYTYTDPGNWSGTRDFYVVDAVFTRGEI